MKKKEDKKPGKEAGRETPKETEEESPSKNGSDTGSKEKSSGHEGKTASDESGSKKTGDKEESKSPDKSAEKTGTKSGEGSDEKSGDKSGGQPRKGSGDKPAEQPRKGSGGKSGEGQGSDGKSGDESRKGSGEKSGESGEQASKESGGKSGDQSRKGSGGDKSGEQASKGSGAKSSDQSRKGSGGDKSGEQASKGSGAKSGDQSRKGSGGDKSGEQASKGSGAKSGEKSGEQTSKGSGVDKSGEQASKGSGEKSGEGAKEPSGEQTTKESGGKSGEQSGKESGEKSGDQPSKGSGDKSGEQSKKGSDDKSGTKSGEKSAEKSSEEKSAAASGTAGSRRKSSDKGSKESSGKKDSGESGVSEKITPHSAAEVSSAGAPPVESRSPLKAEDLDMLLVGKEEAALLPEVATPPPPEPAPPPPPPPPPPAKRSFFSFFRKQHPPPPPGDVEAAAQPGAPAAALPPAPPPAKGGFSFFGKKSAPPPAPATAPPAGQGPDVGSGGDLGPSGLKSVEEEPIVPAQVQPRQALPPKPSFVQRMKGLFSKKPPPPGLQQPPIGGPRPGPQPPGVPPSGAPPPGIGPAGAPPRGPAAPGFAQPAKYAGVPPLDIPESLGDTGSLDISLQKGVAPPPGLKVQGQPPPGLIEKGPAAPGFQKASQMSQKISGSEIEGSQSMAEEGTVSGGGPLAKPAPGAPGFKAAGAPLAPAAAGESDVLSGTKVSRYSDYAQGQQEPAPPLVLPYQTYTPDVRELQFQKLQKKLKIMMMVVVLLFFVILLVVLLCALNVFGCYNMPSFPSIYALNETTVCLSDGCKGFVSRFSATMLSSVDPCEDFYEHVCGGWLHETSVPADSATIDVVTEAQRAIDEEMMDMMNHTVVSYKDQSAMQKAAAAYQGCINMEFRNNKGTKPLENLLDHFGISRWPIVQSTFQADVMKMLADMIREVGLNALIHVRVFPDFHDNQKHAVYVGQPSFGVEPQVLRARFRSPYFRILHRYKLYIYRCSVVMGATVAAADLVNEIVGFESRIAAIAEEATPLPNPRKVYNTLTIKALETAAPLVQWTSFLNNILKDVQVTLDLNDRVIVMNHVYLKRLSELIKDTPEYIVANYLGWRLVQMMGDLTIERMRLATFRFNRYRYSTLQVAPLSRDCFAYVSRYMRFAIGRFYYDRDRQKPIERKEKVQEMADEVKDAFGIWLDLAPWINDANKKTGIFKLREMKVNAGYPLWIKSDGELNDYYARIPDLRKEDFFGAMLKILQEYQLNEFSRLKQYGYANDYGWVETQEQFDPSYQYLGNFLLLAEAYIQEPFFRMTASPSVNYGALGSVLGRYITSGFSAHGSLFNALGNLDDWWNPASRRGYVREARCFASQIQWYTNPFTGEEINGTAHMDSLVVDNAAIKEAYKAYRVYMTKYEELYKLLVIPGLETYTQDQLFFVSFAMTMCEKIRRRSLYTLLNPTPKISNHYRIARAGRP